MNTGTGFAATPDLGLAAYGLPARRLGVMDLHTGKERWTAVATKEYLTALAFSPDGRILASAGGYGESDIRLWDVATGNEVGSLLGHASWVSSLVFWPDGNKLASSGADQTIRLWDVANRKCLDVLRGHRQEVWRLTLLPDEKTLVSGGKDGTVCFWDTSVTHPRQPRATIPTTVLAWCFPSGGRAVLTLDQQGHVTRWSGSDFQKDEALMQIQAQPSVNVFTSCYSRDGRYLAAGSNNGVIQIWDVPRRALWRQMTNTAGEVVATRFFSDDRKLLTWSKDDNRIHVWNLAKALEEQEWQAPLEFSAYAISPDERSCVTIGHTGDVELRNLAVESDTKLKLENLETFDACFSPDGGSLAIASNLGYARVWDTATWREVTTLGGFLNGTSAAAFSPNGKRLAIGSGDKEAVRLWDAESWQELLTLSGRGPTFVFVVFSPDNNAIGSLNTAGVLHLWRAPSWAEINEAEANDKIAAVNSVREGTLPKKRFY